jgi:hypothetical protein
MTSSYILIACAGIIITLKLGIAARQTLVEFTNPSVQSADIDRRAGFVATLGNRHER